ncbi:cuticle protein 19 [Procambarus clarkii]|uniref:cuticle protein 19 n=1 Tax=Procambarus clarkii TaxID=6728 RepID=UPI001E67099C|nr:cuticle protein 19-like [Procambarus clarkii]
MAASVTAMGGPEAFFGYEPEPETESSYTSISSFARAYKPPTYFKPLASVKPVPSLNLALPTQPVPLTKPFLPPQEVLPFQPAPLTKPALSLQPTLGVKSVPASQILVSNKPAPSFKPALFYKVPTKRYNFDWAVKDDLAENDFAHEESRDGDHTRGSYSVLLPDGRVQTVTYYVNGDSGYVAEVTYEGSAQFPSPKPAYRRVPAYG